MILVRRYIAFAILVSLRTFWMVIAPDKDPAAIHKVKQGQTPLIVLGEKILQYPNDLIAAHEKIAVLKKYGANFHYRSI